MTSIYSQAVAVAVADPYLIKEVLQCKHLDKRPNTGYWVVTKVRSVQVVREPKALTVSSGVETDRNMSCLWAR